MCWNGVVLIKVKLMSCLLFLVMKMILCGEVIYFFNCLLVDVMLGLYFFGV